MQPILRTGGVSPGNTLPARAVTLVPAPPHRQQKTRISMEIRNESPAWDILDSRLLKRLFMKLQEQLRYLEDCWDDRVAYALDAAKQLGYLFDLLGSHPVITNFVA